jgi:hypothetical protein
MDGYCCFIRAHCSIVRVEVCRFRNRICYVDMLEEVRSWDERGRKERNPLTVRWLTSVPLIRGILHSISFHWLGSGSFLYHVPLGPMNILLVTCLYSVPQGKVNILGGHSIGHSKQESVYVRVLFRTVSEIELFHCTDEQRATSSHELQSALMLTEFSKKCIILRKLYQLCHLNNKYQYKNQYVKSLSYQHFWSCTAKQLNLGNRSE